MCLEYLSHQLWKCESVETWNYPNVSLCLEYLSCQLWKCGNLEICKCVSNILTYQLWKCGNVEIWKSANVS